MKFIAGLFKLLEGITLFYLAFRFLKWYIKVHVGKYFILFWLYSALCVLMYFNHHQKIKNEYDPRSGQEIWTKNMEDYNSTKGY